MIPDMSARRLPTGKPFHRRLRPAGLPWLAALALVLPALAGCFPSGASDPDPASPPGKEAKAKTPEDVESAPILKRGKSAGKPGKPGRFWVTVLRVIDGVTFSLDTQNVVRLIGVQPPKARVGRTYREYFERVVTPAVRQIVEGKRVYLMRDKVIRGRDGRPLLYVFLEDRTMLNAILIQKGYGRVTHEVPFKFQDEFKLWEREARSIGLGFWERAGR